MKRILLSLMLLSASAAGFNPFAAAVIDNSENAGAFPAYRPAPGQFVADGDYNDPGRALGPPIGAGTNTPDNTSQVSLGGFGGQLVLAFDHDVVDHPANPMGLDATVFGNATWVFNDPQARWAEPATIEIMPEINGSDAPGDHPDERWYVIGGSDLAGPADFRGRTYRRDDLYPPLVLYPPFDSWPDSYPAGAHELTCEYRAAGGYSDVIVNPNLDDADGANDQREGRWGYADYSPTALLGDRDGDNDPNGPADAASMAPGLFYTTPDDPLAVGLSPGAGGGDAFDIAWALDPATWAPAGLRSFRYIRLTTAVDQWLVSAGQVSAEIDAVADVRMICDLDGDNDADLDDYRIADAARDVYAPVADLDADADVDAADFEAFLAGWLLVHPAGDANLDGAVTDADYTVWADNFGRVDADWSCGDFNGDRAVTDADYTLWADNFGARGFAAPAPGVAMLLTLSAPPLLRRRR